MFFRRPTGLQTVVSGAAMSLAKLTALDGFARSLLVGVVPLLAFDALGSKQAVTNAYLIASLLTLMVTLNFATLERLLQRRWVVTLGGSFLVIGAGVVYFASGLEVAFGIGLQSTAASLFSVCMSLYIMDYIGKKELTRSESRRMIFNGAAWLVGPTLGVWLWNNTAAWAPFLLAAIAAVAMVAYFWHLRLGPNEIVRSAKQTPTNPLRVIPRYFSQAPLRTAYLITLSRSTFWMSLFIYGPIYVVEAGLPTWMAGGLLSLVSGLLLFSALVRKLTDHIGTRQTIVCGLIIAGLSVASLYWVGEARPIGLLFWISAAVGGVMLDVLGNIPFMRMVKTRERTEMAMIFSTWREASQLLTPLLVSAVLLVAPFQVYYLVLAGFLFFAAVAASFLPRRL